MQMRMRCSVAALSLCTLAACASSADRAPVADAAAAKPKRPETVLDQAYMARVERAALRRGILVQWVHPPTKPSDDR